MEYPEIVKRMQEEQDGLHDGKITLMMATGLTAWFWQKLNPENWMPAPGFEENVTTMHRLYLESLMQDVTLDKLGAFNEKLTRWLIEQPVAGTHLRIDYHPCKVLRDLATECDLPEDIFPLKHSIFFEPGKTWVQKPDMSYQRLA